MRCPNCGAELDEGFVAAMETAIAFSHRRVGFRELKAATIKLEELKAKYEKEESNG